MSKDEMLALAAKAKEDKGLMLRLSQAGSIEELLNIGREAGFSLNIDDLPNHLEILSDSELEGAAGGHAPPYAGCMMNHTNNLSKEIGCPGNACLFTWRP
jgi:predicted ribosomally synthesized peptide with nif11-like leader